MTHIKIHDFLGGVFTLPNRVRKNVGAHGGKWPMGDFSPMGAPILNDGGINMPMGEINGHQDVLCTVLSYEVSITMDSPHGGLRNTHIG